MAFPLSDESISKKVEKLVLLWDRPGRHQRGRRWGRGWHSGLALPGLLCRRRWFRGRRRGRLAHPAGGPREILGGGWPRSGPRLGPLPRPGLTARLFPALASGNLDKQTAKGSTALHYCCLTDNAECLKLLLRGKASIEIGERHRPAPGRRRAEAAALSRRAPPPPRPAFRKALGLPCSGVARSADAGTAGIAWAPGQGPAALTEAVDLPQVGGRALLSLTHTPDQPGQLVCCGGRCSLCLPPPGTLKCWRSAGRAQSSPRAAGCDEPRRSACS